MGVFTSAHIHMSLGMSKCAGMSVCRVCPQCLHASLPARAGVCSCSLFAHVEWLCFNCGPFSDPGGEARRHPAAPREDRCLVLDPGQVLGA